MYWHPGCRKPSQRLLANPTFHSDAFSEHIADVKPFYELIESEAKANGVDDAIGAFNIDGVVRVGSEGLLTDLGVVDKVFSDGITVDEGGSSKGGQGG